MPNILATAPLQFSALIRIEPRLHSTDGSDRRLSPQQRKKLIQSQLAIYCGIGNNSGGQGAREERVHILVRNGHYIATDDECTAFLDASDAAAADYDDGKTFDFENYAANLEAKNQQFITQQEERQGPESIRHGIFHIEIVDREPQSRRLELVG